MPIIESVEDWWDNVAGNRVNLRTLIDQFHPSDPMNDGGYEITAKQAQAACDKVCAEIRAEENTLLSPVEQFDKALVEKDWQTLRQLFGATWFSYPETTYREPGFSVLCDLCSEDWVFEEEY